MPRRDQIPEQRRTSLNSISEAIIQTRFRESSRVKAKTYYPKGHFSQEDQEHKVNIEKNGGLECSDRIKSPGPEGQTLNKDDLDNLCRVVGRKSSRLIEECEKVCSYIRGISDDIVHVWPAYKTETETVVTFVVLARQDVDLENLEWTTELRITGQYNEKSNTLLFCEENKPLSTDIARKISSAIDIHAEDLMQKHKYLSAISASSAMFEANERGEQMIVTKPCIVLYVLVEEFIPLLENGYPETLEGIPVDVREGEFRFCVASATEFQETLCMGCKITSDVFPDKFGTLGGFVEHPEYGICGITCAHVFLDEVQIYDKWQSEEDNTDDIIVHQPSSAPENSIGRVVKLVLKKGKSQIAGVDLAMFTIEKRPPVAGTFPEDDTSTAQNKYESGKVWGKKGMPSSKRRVHKFGCISGITYGNIGSANMAVREFTYIGKLEGLRPNYTLVNQYQIISEDQEGFCQSGDSGSLVFMEDEQHDLRCIGMVIGFMTDKTTAVTPITDILKEIGVTSFISFQLDPVNKRLEGIENRLHRIETFLMRDQHQ